LLVIPLKVRGKDGEEKLIGLLRADNKKGENGQALATLRFSQEDEWIIAIFAEAAVVAIANAELVEFQERLIANSPDGIIAVDRKGNVTEFNRQAEEILGYEKKEVLGTSVKRLYFDSEEPKKIGDKLRESEDGRLRDYETAVRSKSGEKIPILHFPSWLFDAEGKRRVGSVAYFEDLRPRKAMERRESLLLKASNVVAHARKLDQGLQSLADMMVTLLRGTYCCILLMDEDRRSLNLRAASMGGNPEWRPDRGKVILEEWPGLEELLTQGNPKLLNRDDALARPTLERLEKFMNVETIESYLVVPLKIDDRVVGQLDLGELHGGSRASFLEDEVQLISAIAAQITILIDRSQLLETTERREKLLETLAQASVHIRAEMEMPKLLQTIVRLAAELVGCQVGGLFLNRPHLRQLELSAIHGLPEPLRGMHLSYDSGAIGFFASEEGEAIHFDPQQEEFLQGLDLQGGALVSLRKPSGEVDAVLFVGDSTGPSTLGWMDLEILQAFAKQAAIALRTSRLMDREQHMFSQLMILHRISDYIQVQNDMDKILHAVLTGVTASYGLGFNRAILLLVDDNRETLAGKMGIGQLDYQEARLSWAADDEKGLNHFESYLRRLERGEIETTAVGRKTVGVRVPLKEGGFFSEVVAQHKFRTLAMDELDQLPKNFVKDFKITTPIAVAPLVVEDQVIGILVVDNKFTGAPILSSDSDSLITFASTAAIALDNKRLLQQTVSGADKLLDFYRTSAELITLSDPKEILRMIVGQTLTTAGASWVSIVLIDEASRENTPISVGKRPVLNQQDPFSIRPDGVSMEVMRTGRAVSIANVEKSDRGHPSMLRRGAKAAICLPLSLPGRRIGVMWIHYEEPRRFPDFEVAALQLYVNQAAMAYDGARRMERLAALREASDALAATTGMPGVLRQIVESARSVLQADVAVLWFYDTERDSFIPEKSAFSGDHKLAWETFHQKGPQPRGTAYRIMDQNRVLVHDTEVEEEISRLGHTTREFLKVIEARAFQGLALTVGREKLGVLYAIYFRPQSFSSEETDTDRAFANIAALELKKAKLIDQVQRTSRAAEAVARVTLLENRDSTLSTIAYETLEATECGAVVLFEYDRKAGRVRHPPTMAGVWDTERAIREDEADYSIVHFMLELDVPYIAKDITEDGHFKNKRFAIAEEVKSCVAIPLKAAGTRAGVMFLYYRTKRLFTQAEVSTMTLFANQAAVAIRNAQLFDDLNTKLHQQQALAKLSQELLGAKTVQETLDRAVTVAAAVFDAEFSNIVLPNREEKLVLKAGFGWEPELLGYELGRGTGSQTGYTIQQRRPIPVEDITKAPFHVPEVVLTHGVRSALSAPMFREDEIVGAFLIHTIRARQFTEADEVLLSLIANETAIAIESAGQHEDSLRRSRYLNALYEASKAITAQFGADRRKILDQIMQSAVEGITGISGPKAILGTLQLFAETKGVLILESVYPPEQYEKLSHRIGMSIKPTLRGITGRAIRTGEPQLVADVREDSDYVEYDSRTLSELTVPLLDQHKIIGVLNAESDQVSAFDDEDMHALSALAELAVIAIQSAHQLDELKETRLLASTRTTLAWMGIGNAVRRHEMAGYIGTIRGELYLLERELTKLDSKNSEVKRGLERTNRMIGEAAKINQAFSERADEGLRLILVNKLIRSWSKRFDTGRSGSTSRLRVQAELADSVRIRANLFWLGRVLDILVNNALSATKGLRESTIIIGSRRREDRAEIFVSDSGPGLSETVRQRLFREPIEKPRGSKGLGMGLLIAHAVIEIYGGNLYYEERKPHGTTMVLSLPLKDSANSPIQRKRGKTMQEGEKRPKGEL
jgi:PAS domain S-box-containing protein